MALAALRRVAGYLSKKRQLSKLTVRVPIEVANLLNNRKRKDLLTMAENSEIEIDVIGDANLIDAQIDFFEERRGYAGLRAKAPTRDYWEKSDGGSAHGHRGKGGEGMIKSKPDMPPPSIGPVPTLIEFDENEPEVVKEEKRDEKTTVFFEIR